MAEENEQEISRLDALEQRVAALERVAHSEHQIGQETLQGIAEHALEHFKGYLRSLLGMDTVTH